MEGDDVLLLDYPLDGQGLVYYARDPAGGERRRDEADVLRRVLPLAAYVRAADDEAAHSGVDGAADYVRLVAADEYRVRARERRVVEILRQGYVELAADARGLAVELVHERALEDAEQVEERDVVDAVLHDGLHIVARYVARGEHAEERAVAVHYGHGADLAIAHGAPGEVERHGVVERGGVVIVEVGHLRAHILDERRRVGVEALEEPRRLVVHGAEAHGLVGAVAHRVLKVRVGDGRHDGVRIRVAVPGHVYVAHGNIPPL